MHTLVISFIYIQQLNTGVTRIRPPSPPPPHPPSPHTPPPSHAHCTHTDGPVLSTPGWHNHPVVSLMLRLNSVSVPKRSGKKKNTFQETFSYTERIKCCVYRTTDMALRK